ncbi:MAG: LysR family transcriptional regulator [Bacteroidia bacterium]|nr:LysR family transcriptional regulator [Bacteroidia bacterium]
MPPSDLKAKTRIWIESEDSTFLGYGRIQLLESIHKEGSISKAARSMDMSYVKAWKLIDQMNSKAKVVITATGGKKGGGATVTKYGLSLIKSFNELNDRCEKFADREIKKLDWK